MPRTSLAGLFLCCYCAAAAGACGEGLNLDSPGLVTDAEGRSWTQCLSGQGGIECHLPGEKLTWVDALNRARGFELAGIDNWRMPSIDEIEALYAATAGCRIRYFPALQGAVLWSASANLDYATDAWAFDLEAGKRVVYARDSRLNLLLVAGPQ